MSDIKYHKLKIGEIKSGLQMIDRLTTGNLPHHKNYLRKLLEIYLKETEELANGVNSKPANCAIFDVSCPLCGRGITQKMLDAENYVRNYTEENNKPPTYRQVAKHFNIAVNAAHARLRHCRELMRGRANGS